MAPASVSFGIAYGILASTAGMGSLAPIVMSATTFAGSAQFAAASVLDDGGSIAAAVVAAVLLNARYLAISVAIAGAFEGSRVERFAESQLIVDESWAVAQRGGGRVDRRILVAAGLLLYPCWVLATALGVFGGGLLGNPERFGLDAAFPALFLALLVSVVKTRREIVAALAGGAVALALLPFAKPGVPVIAASAVCLIGLWKR
ncbi:MAG TPA: AzlC family ABC transporter permease [Gaiellaceae bacterium]|nr:AzlC family ABC transporter permease [Gaiellaceae bacterium]